LTVLLTVLVTAVASHVVLLQMIPFLQTDKQIAAGIERGAGINELVQPPVARAGATSVPLANPDTLGSRAYLDLASGPLILTGIRPELCAYWSVSVFAHNTDTVLVKSDREIPSGPFAIGIRRADQTIAEPVELEAVLPSDRGVLLVRCFMRQRDDVAYLANLDAERRSFVLRAAGPEAGQ
jgi:uncharacterized membrane protein